MNYKFGNLKEIKNKNLLVFNLPSNSIYNNLQFALNSTSHSQNDVLANQYNCHVILQLREFIKYGFFRSGHRLQMRNLLQALDSRVFSIKNPEILLLFLQTIYNVNQI